MTSRSKTPQRKAVRFVSRSAEETENIGCQIARDLPVPGVVLLRGALGSGKTTLTRGIARGLGVQDPEAVCSPSFTLVNIYRGVCPVYHVDLYRLEGERDLYSIGLDDFLGGEGVTVVEWSERLPYRVPGAAVVGLQETGENTRIIWIQSPRKRGRPVTEGAARRRIGSRQGD